MQNLEGNNRVLAVGYCRYSTAKQDGGFTIEIQERHIRKLVEEKGWSYLTTYKDEGISGGLPPEERPALGELLEDAKLGKFQYALAYDASRLARDQRIFWNVIGSLKDSKVIFLTVVMPDLDSTKAEFEMIAGGLQGVASYERLLIKRKTKDAMDMLKEKGKVRGRPMFGFRISESGYFEPDNLGVQVLEMLKDNPKVTPKFVMQNLSLEYYDAWTLLKNGKKFETHSLAL